IHKKIIYLNAALDLLADGTRHAECRIRIVLLPRVHNHMLWRGALARGADRSVSFPLAVLQHYCFRNSQKKKDDEERFEH
ncbi:hypothetical protein PMAYCL1PPCAC_13323, partial [Pristionchus mayeri]